LSTNANNSAYNVNIAAGIFAEYWDFIHAVIRYKVRDEASRDDLFQNLFLSLVSRPPSTDVKNIKSYLYKAIINDIIDNTRRVEKYQNRVHRYAEHLKYPIIEDNPENALIEAEEMSKMLECIQMRLQHSEVEAITLRYRNQYKIKEIAEVMGVNNTAAWKYISKGLEKIRQFLRKRQLQ
jgi:RNA polymerase sigma factor (sigma-70 family)